MAFCSRIPSLTLNRFSGELSLGQTREKTWHSVLLLAVKDPATTWEGTLETASQLLCSTLLMYIAGYCVIISAREFPRALLPI